MNELPVQAVNAAAAELWVYERAAVAGIRQEETRYVASRILASAAPHLVAAAEARGRKQAADQIAERLDETYAMTVYGDIARAYAAEQDTSGEALEPEYCTLCGQQYIGKPRACREHGRQYSSREGTAGQDIG